MRVTLNRLTDVNLIQVGQSLLISPPQPPSLPHPPAPSANEETRTAALPPPSPLPLPHSALAALPASSAVSGVRQGPALQSWGHKVQQGDTLTIIAEMYNSSLAEIEALNAQLLSQGPDLLQVGSTVMVPLHIIPPPTILSRSAALVSSGDERGRSPGGGGGGGGEGGGEGTRGGDSSPGTTSKMPSGRRFKPSEKGKGGRDKGGRGGGDKGGGGGVYIYIYMYAHRYKYTYTHLQSHTHTHSHSHTHTLVQRGRHQFVGSSMAPCPNLNPKL